MLTQNNYAFTLAVEYNGRRESLTGIEETLYASAYHATSVPQPKVAVIGVGGGFDVLTSSLFFEASRVVAVEINAATVEIVTGRFADYFRHWVEDPRVELITAEGRHHLTASDERFDVLQLSGVDSYSGTAGAAHSMTALLVKKTPFTHEEEQRVAQWADGNEYLMYSAGPSINRRDGNNYQRFLSLADPRQEARFMAVEIALLQKFGLFLGHPNYALSVVLAALLVSSGIGSLISRRTMSLLGGLRYVSFFAAILPIGLCLGAFVPTGLEQIKRAASAYTPWAWGIKFNY